jgi:hypothetical protein
MIGFAQRGHIWRPGQPNQMLLLRFVDIFRSQIVDGRFLAAARLDQLATELEEHLSAPGTFVIHPLLFQAWGRKARWQPLR